MFARIAQRRQDAAKIPTSESAGRGPLPESLCPSISPSLRRAFTLIELMVVIGIIGLLIAIVVPAISAAQNRAKELTTKAAIGTLETGLEQYRADTRLDGDYPPSVFMMNLAKDPYVSDDTTRIRYICGANLLVWGMAGADLLGTPGFRNLDRSNSSSTATDIYHDPFGGWCSDTGSRYFTSGSVNKPRLYTIDVGQPAISRSGPFVDVSKMKMSEYVATDRTFRIPTANIDAPMFSYCFLDTFNQPILYYKANPKATFMVDAGRSLASNSTSNLAYSTYQGADTGSYNPSGVYNLLDNAPITGIFNSSSGTWPIGNWPIQGMDFGAGGAHRIAMVGASIGISGFQYQGDQRGSFAYTVRNPNINPAVGMRDIGSGLFSPHNSDKFILLSPGIDGIFGTADDIGNFPINKD